ncbi:uncharacterized protein BDZ99DRAFT_525380 [Mytilinidion resinicola]|uniref:Zn(2)-C6 fungal-type domain-containing protein n=1 Tax=Mytilinidion resinicola TaxID=574789 RepID=A0A6A6Y7N4_9PEZI|nr:uncharacterized protein BDZ99DRAFT_525380 [Mytilinidion resinicola]KAF2804543.1 hypothetical protein BDZ99DRAFT_525380 [Mytilinidion resinicola]
MTSNDGTPKAGLHDASIAKPGAKDAGRDTNIADSLTSVLDDVKRNWSLADIVDFVPPQFRNQDNTVYFTSEMAVSLLTLSTGFRLETVQQGIVTAIETRLQHHPTGSRTLLLRDLNEVMKEFQCYPIIPIVERSEWPVKQHTFPTPDSCPLAAPSMTCKSCIFLGIKCDATKPQCGRCRHLGLDCAYPEASLTPRGMEPPASETIPTAAPRAQMAGIGQGGESRQVNGREELTPFTVRRFEEGSHTIESEVMVEDDLVLLRPLEDHARDKESHSEMTLRRAILARKMHPGGDSEQHPPITSPVVNVATTNISVGPLRRGNPFDINCILDRADFVEIMDDMDAANATDETDTLRGQEESLPKRRRRACDTCVWRHLRTRRSSSRLREPPEDRSASPKIHIKDEHVGTRNPRQIHQTADPLVDACENHSMPRPRHPKIPFNRLSFEMQIEMLKRIEEAAKNWNQEALHLCIPHEILPCRVNENGEKLLEKEDNPKEWGHTFIIDIWQLSKKTKGGLPRVQECMRAALRVLNKSNLTLLSLLEARKLVYRELGIEILTRNSKGSQQANSISPLTSKLAPLHAPQFGLQEPVRYGLPTPEIRRPINGLPSYEPFGRARDHQPSRQYEAGSVSFNETMPLGNTYFPTTNQYEPGSWDPPFPTDLGVSHSSNLPFGVARAPAINGPAFGRQVYQPPRPLSHFPTSPNRRPVVNGEPLRECPLALGPRERSATHGPPIKVENNYELADSLDAIPDDLGLLRLAEKHARLQLRLARLERQRQPGGYSEQHPVDLTLDGDRQDATRTTRRRDRGSSHGLPSAPGNPASSLET